VLAVRIAFEDQRGVGHPGQLGPTFRAALIVDGALCSTRGTDRHATPHSTLINRCARGAPRSSMFSCTSEITIEKY
jgi:hypothetical protein